MKIEKNKFKEKESIIPYLIFNIMRNIGNDSDYMKYIHTIRIESDLQYAKLINYKEPTNCFSFELRLKDILKMEATDVYDVLYRTGDRDDIWWREKHIKFTFDCEFDSATIYAIKQAIPGIVQTGNAFEYKEEDSGESARILVGYRKDFSEEYKSKTIVCLCNTMYSIYKSGVWDY